MRSENGIPRPFQPSNLAQELRDLRREVAELKARRNFVSVERIVEGGTINESVGKQLTETVQKDIVIGGSNLAEGALSVDGETVEDVPRPISARLTNVSRPLETRDWNVDTPGLIFSTEGTGNPLTPTAVYSRDGKQLLLDVYDGPKHGSIRLSPDDTAVNSAVFSVGYPSVLPHLHINTVEDYVVIGKSPWVGSSTTDVHLLGNVHVNGNPLDVQHAEFTTAFSLPSGNVNRRPSSPFALDAGSSKNSTFASPAEAGALNLAAGVYAVTFRADCHDSMGAPARLAIVNGAETVTYTNASYPNEFDGTLTHPALYLPVAGKIAFTIKQTSGATRTCDIRVSIEKIK